MLKVKNQDEIKQDFICSGADPYVPMIIKNNSDSTLIVEHFYECKRFDRLTQTVQPFSSVWVEVADFETRSVDIKISQKGEMPVLLDVTNLDMLWNVSVDCTRYNPIPIQEEPDAYNFDPIESVSIGSRISKTIQILEHEVFAVGIDIDESMEAVKRLSNFIPSIIDERILKEYQ